MCGNSNCEECFFVLFKRIDGRLQNFSCVKEHIWQATKWFQTMNKSLAYRTVETIRNFLKPLELFRRKICLLWKPFGVLQQIGYNEKLGMFFSDNDVCCVIGVTIEVCCSVLEVSALFYENWSYVEVECDFWRKGFLVFSVIISSSFISMTPYWSHICNRLRSLWNSRVCNLIQ